MKLTVDIIIELATKRAKIKKLTAEVELLCADIKDRMVERNLQEFAPKGVPLKLVMLEYKKIKKGFYHEMVKKAYKELYGPNWIAQLRRDRLRYPKQDVTAIQLALNENYQQPKLLEKAG